MKLETRAYMKMFEVMPLKYKTMMVIGGIVSATLFLFSFFPQIMAPHDPLEFVAATKLAPSLEFPMGTDSLGRDVMSRCIFATRNTLSVSISAVLISLSIGSTLGALCGFFGSILDRLTSALMDILWSFPMFIIAMLVALTLGPSFTNTAIAISIIFIPSYFRVIRSITLSIKERGYIEAERVIGTSAQRILLRHIAPSFTSTLIALSLLNIAQAALATASLGFLGLGIPPPLPDWGSDLASGRIVVLSGCWWVIFFPGLMIFVTIFGLNLLSESLNYLLTKVRFYIRPS
jgi:peptide/nickel transport system permease protein